MDIQSFLKESKESTLYIKILTYINHFFNNTAVLNCQFIFIKRKSLQAIDKYTCI